MSRVVVSAPAKVNLFLRVLGRETTGFHGLETLFCGVGLADRLELRRRSGGGISLDVETRWDLGDEERNLATRAARAYLDRADLAGEGIEIRLEKRIPPGSGLGGGSSDAAAALRGLDRLFEARVPEHELLGLAAGLGSDVAFFLSPSPLALAWDRGQRLLALPPLPTAPVLLVVPGEAASTADQYRALAALREAERANDRRTPEPAILTPEDLASWSAVGARAVNDFEAVAFDARPAVRRVLADLRRAGASPALLAGSGSALFGVFRSADDAAAAEEGLTEGRPEMELHRTRTLEAWPDP